METDEQETSPAPSTRGIKKIFSDVRRTSKSNASTTSLSNKDSSGSRGLRSSIDSAKEKILARGSGESNRDDAGQSGKGAISKLIARRAKKKRRKREAAEEQREDNEELERGRSIGDRGTDDQSLNLARPGLGDRSQSTLDEDGGSSLITYDSEVDSPVTTPPPLISHQSHIGYLTSTSPLIQTSTVPGGPASPNVQSNASRADDSQKYRSTTFPVSSGGPPKTNLAPRNAATFESSQGGSTLSVDTTGSGKSRATSPGARIKEVFTSNSRKKDKSPNPSPERGSFSSTGAGNGSTGSFGNGDRSNLTSQKSSKPPEDALISQVQNQDTPSTTNNQSGPKPIVIPKTPSNASLDAPLTTVTPPTPPGDKRPELPDSPSRASTTSTSTSGDPNITVSASGNMISHRRIRSDSATHQPSKLSNSMTAPLTPTIEEVRTPGNRSLSGSPAGGFFSQVFSAAQNAANTFTNSIGNNPPRSRANTQANEGIDSVAESGSEPLMNGAGDISTDQPKQLAVHTLGSGDLSLSHLGISSDAPSSSTSSTFASAGEPLKDASYVQRDEAAARAENISAARAVSAAYSDTVVGDNIPTPIAEDATSATTPKPAYETSVKGDRTPPNGSIFEGENGIRRSGSVRSRVGAVTRRHRNSSTTTGTTIGAAISAGHAALGNPAASISSPKLTGFAVASKKRNREYHQLFRSVPEDDYLIEDYSCALQKEIILAGRIYISEGHICFFSNIIGWVTNLVISFDEVVSVEKENTAMIFPNAIAIQTLHARHTFRSLLSREATYDLLVGIWKINHPSLKSSLNGVRLDGGTGDKTEKIDLSPSEEGSDGSEDGEELYDEDEEDDEGAGSFADARDESIMESENGDAATKSVSRKTSAIGVAAGVAAGSAPSLGDTKAAEKAGDAAAASTDFPGPATHAPTECTDGATHYDKVLQDEVIPAPLGKVYSMVFGPASGGFMGKWLLDDQKVLDLQMEDDKKGLSEQVKSRTFSYIKPLNASIGPKQTKCICTETMDIFDLEKAISVTVATQTPDVPSGNVFSVKTKYCLTWASGNSTKILMSCAIEWTGKSWLKGPIEKGANDGQVSYSTDLIKALKAGVSSRSRAGTIGSKTKQKGKRRKGDPDAAKNSTVSKASVHYQAKNTSWGIFEPVHGILGPVADIFGPLVTANTIIGTLIFLLLLQWFRGSRGSSSSGVYPGLMTSPQRMAAYEQIWQREESELWEWLEDRVGMHGLAYPAAAATDRQTKGKLGNAERKRQKVLAEKRMDRKLKDQRMGEREVKEALRVTEERLGVLRDVMQKSKADGSNGDQEGDKGTKSSNE